MKVTSHPHISLTGENEEEGEMLRSVLTKMLQERVPQGTGIATKDKPVLAAIERLDREMPHPPTFWQWVFGANSGTGKSEEGLYGGLFG